MGEFLLSNQETGVLGGKRYLEPPCCSPPWSFRISGNGIDIKMRPSVVSTDHNWVVVINSIS